MVSKYKRSICFKDDVSENIQDKKVNVETIQNYVHFIDMRYLHRVFGTEQKLR